MVVRVIRKEDVGDDVIPWVPVTLPVLESVSHALKQNHKAAGISGVSFKEEDRQRQFNGRPR